jgi:hypothetical protein
MTDEEEFSARSQLKWQRDGDAWILFYRRRRMGHVVPDKDHQGMWRSVKSRGLSDRANLSWAKDAVMVRAVRELAYEAANTPSKCPENRGSQREKSSPIRFSEKAA